MGFLYFLYVFSWNLCFEALFVWFSFVFCIGVVCCRYVFLCIFYGFLFVFNGFLLLIFFSV